MQAACSAIAIAGFVAFIAAYLRSTGSLWKTLGVAAATAAAITTQIAIRSTDVVVATTALGGLLGSIVVVTKGRPEKFFDPGEDADEVTKETAGTFQLKALGISFFFFAFVVFAYKRTFLAI